MMEITFTRFEPEQRRFTIIIRKAEDGTYYCSNRQGVFLCGKFPSIEAAGKWAIDILPNE